MRNKNVIHAPFIQAHSGGGLVYSVTLLSGQIVTNPTGFGVDTEALPAIGEYGIRNPNPPDSNKAIFKVTDSDVEMISCYISMGPENAREADEFLRIEADDWPE